MVKKSKTEAPNAELWSKIISKHNPRKLSAFRNWMRRNRLTNLDEVAQAKLERALSPLIEGRITRLH